MSDVKLLPGTLVSPVYDFATLWDRCYVIGDKPRTMLTSVFKHSLGLIITVNSQRYTSGHLFEQAYVMFSSGTIGWIELEALRMIVL